MVLLALYQIVIPYSNLHKVLNREGITGFISAVNISKYHKAGNIRIDTHCKHEVLV